MSVAVRSYLPGDESALADDVLDGLTRPFKELPPKRFYDRAGAELFDRICELPEYYPTRAERAILAECSGAIAALTGAVELVELGSGTAAKSRLLLSAARSATSRRAHGAASSAASAVCSGPTTRC
jgi:L-histidine N-alpha-methyltransferase